MKIKKAFAIILAIFMVFSISASYAANIPAANASAKKIKDYVDANGADLVSIDTLAEWYKTAGASDTSLVVKIESALKNKSESEIKSYCGNKTSTDLKDKISSGILNEWAGKVSDNSIKKKINDARDNKIKELNEEQKKAKLSSDTITPADFDPTKSKTSDTKAMKKAGKIIGVIQGFGSVVSVGALIYMGIRYMIGSTEEKAMYKETMIPYLIGAILVFAGSNIVGAIYNAVN